MSHSLRSESKTSSEGGEDTCDGFRDCGDVESAYERGGRAGETAVEAAARSVRSPRFGDVWLLREGEVCLT